MLGRAALWVSGSDHPGEEQVPRPWGACGKQGTVRTPGCWESGDAVGRGRAGVPGLRARRTATFTWGPRRRRLRVLAESGVDREQAHRSFPNFGTQLMLPRVCRLLLGCPQGCLCWGSLERSTPRAGVCLELPQLLTHGGVFAFCSRHSACGILAPQAGTEPSGSAES